MKNLFKFTFLFLFLFSSIALIAQTERISIQGTLKDASGSAVSDGSYTVEFRLYHSDTGGDIKWFEEATVDVTGGIYSHYLGSVTPLNEAIFAQTLYMGVKVGSFELVPRTELTYAPYTFASSRVACSGAVGDIKYSILNPAQFADVNGDCWVPLDGTSMSSDDRLADILNDTNLPDMSGLFVRAAEYNEGNDPDRTVSSPVATLQSEEMKAHVHDLSGLSTSAEGYRIDKNTYLSEVRQSNHDLNGSEYVYPSINGGTVGPLRGQFGTSGHDRDAVYFTNTVSETTIPNHTHDITGTMGNVGGAETRPSNMNFYIYVRIN